MGNSIFKLEFQSFMQHRLRAKISFSFPVVYMLTLQYWSKGLQNYTHVKHMYYTHITRSVHKYYTQTTRILRACRCCNPFDRYCMSILNTEIDRKISLFYALLTEIYSVFKGHARSSVIHVCTLL